MSSPAWVRSTVGREMPASTTWPRGRRGRHVDPIVAGRRRDLVPGRLAARPVAGHEHDRQACGGECLGHRASDAGRRAGHERGPGVLRCGCIRRHRPILVLGPAKSSSYEPVPHRAPLESGHGRPRRCTARRGRRPRDVAHLAGGEPRDGPRRVAGDLALAIGHESPRLRSGRRGGALLRLGGQHRRSRRRRPRQALFRAAKAAQRVGRDQQGARRTADPRRADGAGRPRRHRAGQGERLAGRSTTPSNGSRSRPTWRRRSSAHPAATANFAAFTPSGRKMQLALGRARTAARDARGTDRDGRRGGRPERARQGLVGAR